MNTDTGTEEDDEIAYAVVDLRAKPAVVGRFGSLAEACFFLRQRHESASHDVFRLVGMGGICQLARAEAEYARSMRRPARYDDKGEQVQS